MIRFLRGYAENRALAFFNWLLDLTGAPPAVPHPAEMSNQELDEYHQDFPDTAESVQADREPTDLLRNGLH